MTALMQPPLPTLLDGSELLWALGSFCAINRIPFDAELALRRFPPPYTLETLIHAARALGFKIRAGNCRADEIGRQPLPCLVLVHAEDEEGGATTDGNPEDIRPATALAIVSEATAERVVLFAAGSNTPHILNPGEFATRYTGSHYLLKPPAKAALDPDAAACGQRVFGFRWFVPELLKHRTIWRDVLLASLAIQLLALATPLFTQVIIDKVVVHHTESTLIVIGSAVFEHLFHLPPRYFEQRPTGVIAARLHGVETIREYVAGLETVKSLQMEPQLKSRYGDYLADYLHAGFNTRQLGNTYAAAANTLEQLMTLLILVVGAYTVMNGTDFTIGMLVAFQMFAGRLSQPMLRLVGLQQASLSVARLGDIMNAPMEPYSLIPTRVGGGHGQIEIEGVSFRYGENLPYLYRNLTLSVAPGKTVVIMGPSGSGKSTLAKLLQGFYQPSDGHIKLDGTDIRHFSANELRSRFGVVPQETVLFSGTIYDNLLMANAHATFEQVVQACRMAEIHDVVERLPQGYQTEIGERGSGLSGGQRQRLAIARALLKRPKILIFDEATSNLDAHTAEHFARTVNQLHGKVTMLFITHHIPKGLHVDEVFSLSQAQGATKMAVVVEERREGRE